MHYSREVSLYCKIVLVDRSKIIFVSDYEDWETSSFFVRIINNVY